MKKIFLILFFINYFTSQSQSNLAIDSLTYKMCSELNMHQFPNDSLLLENVFQKKIYPYLDTISPEKQEKVYNRIVHRFQRNCPDLRSILRRMNPPKNEMNFLRQEPKSEITSIELKKFKKIKTFYYKEVDGEKTQVEIKHGYWIESFSDQTHSELKIEWINKNKFALIFIESDNLSRSNFSFPGDRLNYKILDQKEDLYILSANIEGQKDYTIFKLYFS